MRLVDAIHKFHAAPAGGRCEPVHDIAAIRIVNCTLEKGVVIELIVPSERADVGPGDTSLRNPVVVSEVRGGRTMSGVDTYGSIESICIGVCCARRSGQ